MHNIFVFERKPGSTEDLFTATFAREGEIVVAEESGRRYLELRGGSRYRGEPGERALEEITFNLYGELIPESQNSLRRSGKVESLASADLWTSDEPRLRGALVAGVVAGHGACDSGDCAGAKPDRCEAWPYAKIGPAMVVLLLYFSV